MQLSVRHATEVWYATSQTGVESNWALSPLGMGVDMAQ